MADRQTTAERLAEIQARVNAATEGPWEVVGPPWNEAAPWINAGSEDPHGGSFVCDFVNMADDGPSESRNSEADAEFVAHARDDVPWLLSELSRLVGEHDTLRNTLREIAECAGWYAKNSDRIALEVDHALCVEVLSYAEDALAAVPDPQEPRKVWGAERMRHDPEQGVRRNG